MRKQLVTFLESRVVQDGLEGTPDETAFKEGQSYKLDIASAERWIRRGVAALAKDVLPAEKRARNQSPGQFSKSKRIA